MSVAVPVTLPLDRPVSGGHCYTPVTDRPVAVPLTLLLHRQDSGGSCYRQVSGVSRYTDMSVMLLVKHAGSIAAFRL